MFRQTKETMKLLFVSLLALAIAGCGGGAGTTTQSSGATPTQTANIQGSWEVAATSSQPSIALPLTFVETNLTQASGSNSFSSVSSQTTIFSTNTSVTLAVIGSCTGSVTQSVSGTINGTSISGTFTEGSGAVFAFTGTLNAAGTSFNGTYNTETATANCTDQGTFVATKASPLSGTYAGTLEFSDGTINTLTLTVNSQSNNTVTATGTISGPDAGTISVGGTVLGDVADVTGIETPGGAIHIYGWLHNGNLYIADVNASLILGFLTKQ
jgi:hypothetical protein